MKKIVKNKELLGNYVDASGFRIDFKGIKIEIDWERFGLNIDQDGVKFMLERKSKNTWSKNEL